MDVYSIIHSHINSSGEITSVNYDFMYVHNDHV